MLSTPDIRKLLARLDGAPADALESVTVEFKTWESAPDTRKSQVRVLREAAVAFANANGGVLVLGVADRKRTRAEAIQGVGDLDPEGLRRDIYDGTDPHILVDIEALEEPEGRVFAIRIPRGLGLHTTTDGVARLRVAKESKPLTGSNLAQALVGRGRRDLSAEAVPGASLADLDPRQIERLRRVIEAEAEGGARRLAGLPDEELLRALELLTDDGLTLAAILLLGARSALARHCPNSEIIFARHSVAPTRYEARSDLKGTLLGQLDELLARLRAHTGLTTVALDGLRDLEVPDVSRWAARESVLNAVCHRDWFVNQSIHVSLHSDRLEIESPGGFMGGVTPANVMRHPPVRRNPLLASVFQTIGLANRAGLGVDRLHEEALRAGKRPPRYEADSGYVRLILPTRTDPDFAAFVAGERETGSELELDDLLVLEALTRGAELDRWTAADCLQIGETAAADRLVSLRERGYLVPSGRGRGTRYRLAGRLARLGRRPEAGADATMREQILELLSARGAITNTDVRRLTGASRVRALQLLRGLVADGLLRMTGNRGGARYVAGPRLG